MAYKPNKHNNFYTAPDYGRCVVTSYSPIPFLSTAVNAGFPAPADDYIESEIDLNEMLITRPSATFFMKVEGDSMINAGIQSGDMLIVDRSIEPTSGRIVVAALNGDLTVKRIEKRTQGWFLVSANEQYPAIAVTDEMEGCVWGVVTYVIHPAK